MSVATDAKIWLHDNGENECFEIYSSTGFIGSIDAVWKTAWCSKASLRFHCAHHTKCGKLIGLNGRSMKEMFDIIGQWCLRGASMNHKDHRDCRPKWRGCIIRCVFFENTRHVCEVHLCHIKITEIAGPNDADAWFDACFLRTLGMSMPRNCLCCKWCFLTRRGVRVKIDLWTLGM